MVIWSLSSPLIPALSQGEGDENNQIERSHISSHWQSATPSPNNNRSHGPPFKECQPSLLAVSDWKRSHLGHTSLQMHPSKLDAAVSTY
ncbi:hypothetical protein XELAEV_18018945mg [Xenopus laevis]|uniref:Uncharacterized protein n=1 Tax=Xenopus laevis TaxID=8355 RepID=A0A974HTX6_XENLA|nr:hypothetical protein XELAEV_18018945mg [Xenopus laevis]